MYLRRRWNQEDETEQINYGKCIMATRWRLFW